MPAHDLSNRSDLTFDQHPSKCSRIIAKSAMLARIQSEDQPVITLGLILTLLVARAQVSGLEKGGNREGEMRLHNEMIIAKIKTRIFFTEHWTGF